jgi:hypothetical protein
VAPRIDSLTRSALEEFLFENLSALTEDETLAALQNPYITPQLIGKIAQNPRLTGFYGVRLRMVAHRQTPQAHAVKLVHYLYWFDLVRLSIDVQIPAPVRRSIDTQLLMRVEKLSLGERIASARRCGGALLKFFLFDPSAKVFESVLLNQRLREDDLLALVSSSEAGAEKLAMVAANAKWSYRYAVRKALVLNPITPRAAAASQLRFLSRSDLRQIHGNPSTSVYLRRCIERMRPDDFTATLRSD